MQNVILEIIGVSFILLGVVVSAAGVVGIFRLPDIYSHIHSSGKVSTVGVICIGIGAAFLRPEWLPRLLILVTFIVLVNPAAGHAIAKAAFSNGEPMADPQRNDYEELNNTMDTGDSDSNQ